MYKEKKKFKNHILFFWILILRVWDSITVTQLIIFYRNVVMLVMLIS